MSPNPSIRVLCVDDHPIVLEAIALMVSRQRDMEVVGTATSGERSVSLFKRLRPDVTLMDLQLRTLSGLEAIRAIRRVDPGARIVVLTTYQGDEDIHRALDAGAASYLLKDAVSAELIRVVRLVHAGERPLRADVQARLAERSTHPTLTPREVQVIELVAVGRRNRAIAEQLGITEETVQAHMKHIFWKLHVEDRTAAVSVALRRGIIHLA